MALSWPTPNLLRAAASVRFGLKVVIRRSDPCFRFGSKADVQGSSPRVRSSSKSGSERSSFEFQGRNRRQNLVRSGALDDDPTATATDEIATTRDLELIFFDE